MQRFFIVKHKEFNKQQYNMRGFTLLELLICLVIMAILLKVGIGSLQVSSSQIQKNINIIIDTIVQAKTESIFLNDNVELVFFKDKILTKHKNIIIEETLLSDASPIQTINKNTLFNKNYTLHINKFGIITESLMLLKEGEHQKSLYIPSIGRMHIIDYYTTIEHVYKDIL